MCDLGIARHLVVTRRHLTGLDLVVDLDLIVDLDLVVDLAATAATLKCRAHPRIARLLYRRASLVTLAKVPAVVPEVGIVLTPPSSPSSPSAASSSSPSSPSPSPSASPSASSSAASSIGGAGGALRGSTGSGGGGH